MTQGKRPAWSRSPRLRALRAEVYTSGDFTCKHCGWRPPNVPEDYDGSRALSEWFGSGWDCSYLVLEIDHIIPVARGGTNARENLQLLCNSCNARKCHRMEDELVRS